MFDSPVSSFSGHTLRQGRVRASARIYPILKSIYLIFIFTVYSFYHIISIKVVKEQTVRQKRANGANQKEQKVREKRTNGATTRTKGAAKKSIRCGRKFRASCAFYSVVRVAKLPYPVKKEHLVRTKKRIVIGFSRHAGDFCPRKTRFFREKEHPVRGPAVPAAAWV